MFLLYGDVAFLSGLAAIRTGPSHDQRIHAGDGALRAMGKNSDFDAKSGIFGLKRAEIEGSMLPFS
jgi:hypothetical protein